MSDTIQTRKMDGRGLTQLWSLIKNNFVSKETGKGLSANDYTTADKEKLRDISENAQANVIEQIKVNDAVQEVSAKAVNITVPTGALADKDKVSSGDLDATLSSTIDGKATKATTLEGYGIGDAYTKTQTDNAIQAAVDVAVTGLYKVKGSIMFSELPTSGMKEGYVYNIKDQFETTADFLEGAGKTYPAGTNVAYTASNKWDCMAGTYDFSDFLMKDDIVDLTEEDIATICVMD